MSGTNLSNGLIDLSSLGFDEINRFELITNGGREVVIWEDEPLRIEVSFQDDDRTLKLFVTRKKDE